MRRHDFGYFVHEGVVNLFSHGFMSFAAVGITVACLLVMGTFSLVAYNVNEQLRQLESENEILAFVDDTLTEAQGRSLQSAVEAVPNVRSVRFITREEACETFEKKYEGKYALGDLDPEILRDRFAIKVIDLGRMEETREAVKKVTGIADARAEGVLIHAGWGVREVEGKDGRVRGLVLRRCLSVWDDAHAFRPVFDDNETREVGADAVVFAIGQASDLSLFPNLEKASATRLKVDPVTFGTSIWNVFAAGDAVTGPNIAIRAIRAEMSIRGIDSNLDNAGFM